MAQNDFLNSYKENSRMQPLSKLENSANNSIIIDFYIKSIKGDKKIKDPIEEYNTEHLIKNNDIIPGHIYSFIYKADKPAAYQINNEIIEFTDKLPIVLVLKNNGNIISGINLNLCNRDMRVIILNLVQNLDNEFFEKGAIEMIKKGQPPISKKLLTLFAKDNINEYLLGYLKKLANIDYNVLFRTYSVSKIKQINRLELWQWKNIPYVNYKDSIKQDVLQKIWDITGISKIKLN